MLFRSPRGGSHWLYRALRGLYWPVEAGASYVEVVGVAVVRQHVHQRACVHVVVIIHMAEPPTHTNTHPPHTRLTQSVWVNKCVRVFYVSEYGCVILASGEQEVVILGGHLAGQRLAIVGRRTIGVDHVTSCCGMDQ